MNYEDRVTKEYIENALANAGVKIVTGTYTGNGAETRFIDLGFTPRAVVVYGRSGIQVGSTGYAFGGLAFPGHPSGLPNGSGGIYPSVEAVTGGFNVACYESQGIFSNGNGNTYYYLAIT